MRPVWPALGLLAALGCAGAGPPVPDAVPQEQLLPPLARPQGSSLRGALQRRFEGTLVADAGRAEEER